MVEPKRLSDEQFGSLSRLLAGEALLRLEEAQAQVTQCAPTESEAELRYELEGAANKIRALGDTIVQLRNNNADLLKRLQLLGKAAQ